MSRPRSLDTDRPQRPVSERRSASLRRRLDRFRHEANRCIARETLGGDDDNELNNLNDRHRQHRSVLAEPYTQRTPNASTSNSSRTTPRPSVTHHLPFPPEVCPASSYDKIAALMFGAEIRLYQKALDNEGVNEQQRIIEFCHNTLNRKAMDGPVSGD